MGRARDISKVFSTGTALATDTEVSAFNYLTQSSASTVYQTKATAGLTLLTPGSITNTGGTASVGANGTVTFSGVSSQSINDVFSTTYDNYKLVIKLVSSVETRLDFRMRVSGADNTTSNYYKESNIAKDTGVAGAESLAQDKFIGYGTNTTITPILFEVFSPFIAEATGFLGWNHKVETLATVHENNFSSGIHNVASSFTGISLIAASGTITGTVSVYGYNK